MVKVVSTLPVDLKRKRSERILKRTKEKIMKKFLEKLEIWSLYYRTEIIWFIAGFVTGAIIL